MDIQESRDFSNESRQSHRTQNRLTGQGLIRTAPKWPVVDAGGGGKGQLLVCSLGACLVHVW